MNNSIDKLITRLNMLNENWQSEIPQFDNDKSLHKFISGDLRVVCFMHANGWFVNMCKIDPENDEMFANASCVITLLSGDLKVGLVELATFESTKITEDEQKLQSKKGALVIIAHN